MTKNTVKVLEFREWLITTSLKYNLLPGAEYGLREQLSLTQEKLKILNMCS